jgi:hypothetical protein
LRAAARRVLETLTVVAVGFLFAAPACAVLGDVNGDGAVNVQDAQLLANYLVGNSTSLPHPENADVNGDGQINVADAMLILQLAKGLRTGFAYQFARVLAVTPSSGTANILLGAEVSVIFSNPISSASLPGNFTVTDAISGVVSTGTFRCSQNGTISVFTPAQAFLPARAYAVALSTGITDTSGNHLSAAVTASFQTQALGTMSLTSVNNSTTTLSTLLSQPISVRLVTSTGAPAAQIPVVFTGHMGNGTFQPSGLRQVTVLTDANGNASIAYKTGTQAMVNTVLISAVGFSSAPVFQVQTMSTPVVNLRIYTGINQSGAPGSVAPRPLIVQATDAGGDSIAGTTVTFVVSQGEGNFSGQISSSVVTDSTGTAGVMFTFGASTGPVQIQASFPGMLGIATVFNLNSLAPQPSSPTLVVGDVIDAQTLMPLTSVYVYLADNPSIWERTDTKGVFALSVSSGPHVVVVNTFESGLIGGNMYPTVSYPINAVQGQTNTLGMPAMLPVLDNQSYLDVSDVQGGTLTMRSNPLWQLYVAPGQVTFQDGSHTGRLYASVVAHDKIPMPVAGGKFSHFDDTVQPPTVVFNPPAQVTFPNADGQPAGTVTDIFTLDYVSGAFKRTGRGLVSSDGATISSLPGQGITQGGWHSAPPPQPPPPGCIGGNYYFGGNQCSQASLSGYGTPSSCTSIKGYLGWYQCLLCGQPTNQGPLFPTAHCTLAPGAPPPIGGPGGTGGPGPGGGPPPSPPSPTNPPAPPNPPTPPVPSTLPQITGLAVELSTDTVFPGEAVKITVTVLFDTPPADPSGIPVRFIDQPGNVIVFSGAQVPNIADTVWLTDMHAQVVVFAFVPYVFAALEDISITTTIDAMHLAANVALAAAFTDVAEKFKIGNDYEVDTSALIDMRNVQPDAAAIESFILARIGHVSISQQAYAEFINPVPQLPTVEKNARLGILAANQIFIAPPPSFVTVSRFLAVGNPVFGSPGDAEVLSSASEHGSALILSDKKVYNAYINFSRAYSLPQVTFIRFTTNFPGEPITGPTLF